MSDHAFIEKSPAQTLELIDLIILEVAAVSAATAK